MLGPGDYRVGEDGVFLRNIRLAGADPGSFRHVYGYWSRDDDHVFWATSRRTKIDAASFVPLNDIWCRDRAAVYAASGNAVKGADPDTFRALDAGMTTDGLQIPNFMPEGYGADDGGVWFHNATYPSAWRLRSADARTFLSMGNNYGRDCRAVYWEKQVVKGADPGSFILHGDSGYATDHGQAYYQGQCIAGADAATFVRMLSWTGMAARDKDRYYVAGRPVGIEEYLEQLRREVELVERFFDEARTGEYERHFRHALGAKPG
jgi:hypothetical protein